MHAIGPDAVTVHGSVVASGRIIGYQASHQDGIYLKADADLRAGRDLIVAPDDAVARALDDQRYPPATSHRWDYAVPPYREY